MFVVSEGYHAGCYVLQRDIADIGASVEVRDTRGKNQDARPERDSLQALLDSRAMLPVGDQRLLELGYRTVPLRHLAGILQQRQSKTCLISIAGVPATG